MIKRYSQAGLSMIELMMGVAISGGLMMAVYSLTRMAEKESNIFVEDIQTLIAKLGGQQVMSRDIADITPSFNYLNLEDNDGLSFYDLDIDEQCKKASSGNPCSRTFTLKIDAGQLWSRPFFALIVSPNKIAENTKFRYNPETAYHSGSYAGINHMITTAPSESLVPDPLNNHMVDSPWYYATNPERPDRLTMLISAQDYFDCSHYYLRPPLDLNATDCSRAMRRPLKLVASIKADQVDMEFHELNTAPPPANPLTYKSLFKYKYQLCAKSGAGCTPIDAGPTDWNTAQKLITNQPYKPGYESAFYIQPVKLVRYHLQRMNVTDKPHKYMLIRSVAYLTGSKLSFTRAHTLMVGVEQVVFSRPSLGSPSIGVKILTTKARDRVKY